MWLLYAFIAPAAYGVAEILDNFLSNKIFKNPLTLSFFSALCNPFVVLLLFLFERPTWPPASTIPIFLVIGFIELAYLYPYYKGLQNDDTSIVAAFFGIGRIFVPILAFFVVGEVLSIAQYAGVALIVFSSIALSFKKEHAKMLFSRSLWYIGLAAFMLSFEGVLLKYLFDHGVQFSTAVGGEMLVATAFSIPLLFVKNVRSDIATHWKTFKKFIPLFSLEEGLTFIAFSAETYAISLAPVTIVKSVGMFIPFFVLFYGKMLKTRLPLMIKENTENKIVLKRTLLFAVMVAGIMLLGNYD
ncbi:MAG: EamA family transporter [Patescibacteria group bacterium]